MSQQKGVSWKLKHFLISHNPTDSKLNQSTNEPTQYWIKDSSLHDFFQVGKLINILVTISLFKASSWFVVDSVINSRNMYSSNLVWWNGTKFDYNFSDGTYAKIDNQSQSWYFAFVVFMNNINSNGNPLFTKT